MGTPAGTMRIRFHNFIDGEFVPARSESWLDIYAPAKAEIYAQCPASEFPDADAAVQAARDAYPAWSRLTNAQRAHWLNKLADAIEAQIDRFAQAESTDTGKPLSLTSGIEIPRAVENLRFFAACAQTFASESHHGQAGLNYTLRTPLGVAVTISPWNLPLYLFTWKFAPALASGNTVVAKPSEITPASADLLAQVLQQIQFPKGVLNIVHGRGEAIGKALVEHPEVKAVSFTGSTTVGKRIAVSCAESLKKYSLEMGGKNATLIFQDANLDALIDTLVRSAFQNAGQICLCGSRILIHASIYEPVRDRLIERAQALKPGGPDDVQAQVGPMVSEAHYEKVLGYIDLAKQEGAKVLCGGMAAKLAQGWFIQPTILEGIGPEARCNREEIFGPVVTLQRFIDDDQAIKLANDTSYGLSASIWTQDLNRAHRVASRLETGIVWITTWMMRDLRTPFGGVKHSGVGREGGWEAMRFFTETKNVCINLEA